MLLCIDVGNTNIFSGVFDGKKLLLKFRYHTRYNSTSDELGIFLINVLRENNINPKQIDRINICSVVPNIDYSLTSACKKYFNLNPFFLTESNQLVLKIKTRNPREVGSDLVADAIAAVTRYPDKNIIVVNFGTATTFSAISCNAEYLGAIIIAGVKLSMNSLHNGTAKLFPVEIVKPSQVVGRSTTESIQSGLYYGHLGMIKEIVSSVNKEHFANNPAFIVATGGLSHIFVSENLFDVFAPDLVLEGLNPDIS